MIRLYLDEDVHKQAAEALRLRGYDVVSVHEVKTWHLSDAEQLEYAVKNERAIFSFNRGDFSKIHNQYLTSNRHHFGIIVSKQQPLSNLIRVLNQFLFTAKRETTENQIIYL